MAMNCGRPCLGSLEYGGVLSWRIRLRAAQHQTRWCAMEKTARASGLRSASILGRSAALGEEARAHIPRVDNPKMFFTQ